MDIEVPIGEIKIATSGNNLIALGIGSCLIIIFYDMRQKIGAMAHTMLPGHRLTDEHHNYDGPERRVARYSRDVRYTDDAIDELLGIMTERGSKKEYIEVKIVGGANMFSAFFSDISDKNILHAKKKLKKIGMAISGEVVGGSQGRSVELSVDTGLVTVKTKF